MSDISSSDDLSDFDSDEDDDSGGISDLSSSVEYELNMINIAVKNFNK